MPWHDVVSSELGEGREEGTSSHTYTSLIKCGDELDSGLVRGTLLMLIRGLEGYPSSWSREKNLSARGNLAMALCVAIK